MELSATRARGSHPAGPPGGAGGGDTRHRLEGAGVRLCARYRRLAAKGKPLPLVVAAIARELVGFAWAIARQVAAAKAA